MTSVSDMLFHLGDVPVLAKLPFMMNSNYYFVDGTNGGAARDGKSPDQALDTWEEAIALMNARIDWSVSRWAMNDVLVIAPGSYAENLTSLPYGATIFGLGFDLRDAQNGVKLKPASGVPIDVNSAINLTMMNIGIEALASVAAFDADICNNVKFKNVRFAGGAAEVTATGFVTKDAVATEWFRCEFVNLDKGIDVNYADANDSFTEALIDKCLFHRIDTAGIEISTNLVGGGATVRDTMITGGGVTLAKGIDDNSGILDIVRCDIIATDPVEGCRSCSGTYGNAALLGSDGEP